MKALCPEKCETHHCFQRGQHWCDGSSQTLLVGDGENDVLGRESERDLLPVNGPRAVEVGVDRALAVQGLDGRAHGTVRSSRSRRHPHGLRLGLLKVDLLHVKLHGNLRPVQICWNSYSCRATKGQCDCNLIDCPKLAVDLDLDGPADHGIKVLSDRQDAVGATREEERKRHVKGAGGLRKRSQLRHGDPVVLEDGLLQRLAGLAVQLVVQLHVVAAELLDLLTLNVEGDRVNHGEPYSPHVAGQFHPNWA